MTNGLMSSAKILLFGANSNERCEDATHEHCKRRIQRNFAPLLHNVAKIEVDKVALRVEP